MGIDGDASTKERSVDDEVMDGDDAAESLFVDLNCRAS